MRQEPEEQNPTGEPSQPEGDGQEALAPAPQAEESLEALDPDTLRERLKEAERERVQFKAMAQRAQADLLNYSRRVAEERQELVRHANAGLILKLLPIVDDFQRALEHVPVSPEEQRWLEGVTLILRKLTLLLEREGLTRIEAQGRPFDPREHEALLYEEVEDGPEGTVLRVIRDGYKLEHRVLRPAQVSVSKAKGNAPAEADSPAESPNDNPSGEKEE